MRPEHDIVCAAVAQEETGLKGPAIGIGGERGGRRGFPDEWGDIPQTMRTATFVALLAATIGSR